MLRLLSPALMSLEAMARAAIAQLPQLLLGFALFWIFLRLARVGRDWTRHFLERGGHSDAAQVLGQLAYGALVVAGAGTAAAVMGIGLGRVLAGIGVSGVVVGFAFKDILENYLAGILLMLARPFHPGDTIKTGDHEGVVQVVSTRSTTIKTFDGQLVVVPNAKIYSQPLVNESALGSRRQAVALRVRYDRDLDDVRRLALEIAAGDPRIFQDPPPDLLATGLDAAGVNLELRFWSRTADAAAARSRVVEEVKRQLYSAEPPPE
ncbi:MAG: mechanosensitive ion channel family protein [Cyanobacteria bacterium REEB65]|nr:mechanosensitive ion channel family protein [Cyanobacteria bacterium REEB65]